MDLSQFTEPLAQCSFEGWRFVVALDGSRPYLQVEANDKCARSGNTITWRGRKWFLSPFMSKSEVVQTALKAVLTALEHEARERFLYRGQPVFGPHFDVDRLADLCASSATDERTAP
jgi:hypothetical protein